MWDPLKFSSGEVGSLNVSGDKDVNAPEGNNAPRNPVREYLIIVHTDSPPKIRAASPQGPADGVGKNETNLSPISESAQR